MTSKEYAMEPLTAFYLFVIIAGIAIIGLSIFYVVKTAKKTMKEDEESSQLAQQQNADK